MPFGSHYYAVIGFDIIWWVHSHVSSMLVDPWLKLCGCHRCGSVLQYTGRKTNSTDIRLEANWRQQTLWKMKNELLKVAWEVAVCGSEGWVVAIKTAEPDSSKPDANPVAEIVNLKPTTTKGIQCCCYSAKKNEFLSIKLKVPWNLFHRTVVAEEARVAVEDGSLESTCLKVLPSQSISKVRAGICRWFWPSGWRGEKQWIP